MDFKKLEETTKKIGGIVVMEGDEPSIVILPYEKYLELGNGAAANGLVEPVVEDPDVTADEALIEALNQEIVMLKEKARQKEEEELQGI